MNQVEESKILRKVEELNEAYKSVLKEKKTYANSLVEAYEKEIKLLTTIKNLQTENAKLKETNTKLKNNYQKVHEKLAAIYKFKSYILVKIERKLTNRTKR